MSTGHEILFPRLPYDMAPRVGLARRDISLQQFVHQATRSKDAGRRSAMHEAFGERADDLRRLAGQIKQHTLDHLDHYLGLWIDRARAAGTTVHVAESAEEANEICLSIARRAGCTSCVKSKSMVTEETGLLAKLAQAGIPTLETDLGEFIVQLDGDAPSHIVTPMIHKDRRSVARAFVRELSSAYTEDPRALTMIAREHMRASFRRADLGVTGANFLLAESGGLVLCTNEGNADLTVACPRVHVAMVGIEKVIPSVRELPLFLKLLARSATAQPITVYTTILTGGRRVGEDGPEESHVILVDAGRTRLLREEARELLRCIRCGACLNACPVYRKAGGGHAYGAVYSGPIGAVLTPELRGLMNYADLPLASSLCGACFEACPVAIDIPHHLLRLRTALKDAGAPTFGERAVMRLWGWVLRSPGRYRLIARLAGWVMRRLADGSDEDGRLWLRNAPGPAAGWTRDRDLPAPAEQSFRDLWALEESR